MAINAGSVPEGAQFATVPQAVRHRRAVPQRRGQDPFCGRRADQ